MLTNHAIKRCYQRKIDVKMLDDNYTSGNYVVSLTQPDGTKICWTVINNEKVHFILVEDRIITVLWENTIPSYLLNINSGSKRKTYLKRYGKMEKGIIKRKKDRLTMSDYFSQLEEL